MDHCTVKYVPGWFPGAGFKAAAQRGRELSTAVRMVPYKETKAKVVCLLIRITLKSNDYHRHI